MHFLKIVTNYLDPISHLGERKYSVIFPLVANLVLVILSELFVYVIAKNPQVVGTYIIFLNVAFIIYFSFRDGIRGGFISVAGSILYYFYIIYNRNYTGAQLTAGIQTIISLALVYALLAIVIGWLKQTIDKLIEREANEKIRLQTILQQLPVGVIITDNNGKIEQTNKQLAKTFGIKTRAGMLVSEENSVPALQQYKQIFASGSPLAHALKTGKAMTDREIEIIRPDGKKIYINANASIIQNKSGKVIAAASIISDVTQQKELEVRKDDFVNMASHELKTPITSMKLYIDSLMRRINKSDDERAVKILSNIKQQTERLQALVNDLLDVSRLQTGKLTFTRELFSIDTLLKETIEDIQGATQQQTIVYEGLPSLSVYADRFRIYQVITNLITNAIKYSPDGKEIYVRLKKMDAKAVVSVQDFGIGIAKDQQNKIFERLYQVNGDTEKTFPGFGMGLFICKEIIKKNKGALWVESKKGKGSTFYFSLPMQKE